MSRLLMIAVFCMMLSGCGEGSDENIESAQTPADTNSATLPTSPPDQPPPTIPEASTGDHDLVGILLGMTPAEATAALEAHNPKFVLQESKQYLAYTFGSKNHRASDDYVSKILAKESIPQQIIPEMMEVLFSTPPGDVRVVSVMRNQYLRDLTGGTGGTPERYREALVAKYGEPTFDYSIGQGGGGGLVFYWHLSEGKQACFGPAEFKFHDTGGVVEVRTDHQNLRNKAASECGSVLTYWVNYVQGRVQRVKAHLVAVGESLHSSRTASALLQELTDKANQEAAEQGAPPKL